MNTYFLLFFLTSKATSMHKQCLAIEQTPASKYEGISLISVLCFTQDALMNIVLSYTICNINDNGPISLKICRALT